MAWDRIRGHDGPREQLLAAESRGRLPHSFLFVGPRGIGKQTFATEFAKALLCEKPPAPLTACDACPACAQVAVDSHPDLYRAQKEEERTEFRIEVMRTFCDHLGLKPTRGFRKIGIVEDADDFNEESANCFLKTLEEPPPGLLLILLATSSDMQLSTILSRCQVVRFNPLKADDLKAVLGDHEVTDPTTLHRLTRLAGGSPGRALELADNDLWEFRSRLVSILTGSQIDAVSFSSEWLRFIEDAGKEAREQRQRASLTISLVIDLIQTALRISVDASSVESGDGLSRLADRHDTETIADMLEACTEADYLLERRVQTVLVIEALVDKLCRRGVQMG